MVGRDREAHPRFVVDLINEERAALANKRKKTKQTTLEPIVLAHNDLGGSDSERSGTGLLGNEGDTRDEDSDEENDIDSDDDSLAKSVNRIESV